MTGRNRRAETIVGLLMTLGCMTGLLLSGTPAAGFSLPLAMASAAAITTAWCAMHWLSGRAPALGWGIVWLACFGWFSAAVHVGGDPILLPAMYAAILATIAHLVLMASVYLGPGSIAAMIHD